MADAVDTAVREAMTEPLRTVDSDLNARDAAAIMMDEAIGSVVVDDPAGIVTKTDLVRGVQRGVDLDETAVSALMSSPLLTVDADADLQVAINRMETHGVKRLPVTADSGLVGIISVTDLAAELAVELDTVVGMFPQTASVDGSHTYECLQCGHRATTDDRPAECPECGGRLRNISVARE
jgi:signal-transduction protein with cAMP-binding, CBS, and nucleotidyltransferase domain